ncbi:unnamed protein product [Rotaria sp. Silwood1]|nr:unnamed protein product [Rotaria sp. Silwood1]CAF1687075.1 unnamed protein product [Rotaria sp. Silwood1]CAF4974293.1 unnamed protein product [Rotaria sp. Silwood1]CAF5011779.1 unnamed protein product [Rotaria sp. Silwood1]
MQENIWSGRVSKKWAAMTSMHQTYGRSKTLIVQHLTTLQRQLQEDHKHYKNFTTMSAMVTAVVGKGQHKLKQPFEYNKKMLKLDSTDHRFVQYVYDLKPNKQQIRSIRNIWKAIYNKKAC